MTRPQRIRRTPEEARAVILGVAATRLAQQGIKGLNVKAIAKDAGINHATILHHFGSAEGMRDALLLQMSEDLIRDMSEILNSDTPPDALFIQLFTLMSQSGHIKLIAWHAMNETDEDLKLDSEISQQLFAKIISNVSERLDNPDKAQVKNIIMLAVSSAIGWGICGTGLEKMLGLEALGVTGDQQSQFPAWVGSILPNVLVQGEQTH